MGTDYLSCYHSSVPFPMSSHTGGKSKKGQLNYPSTLSPLPTPSWPQHFKSSRSPSPLQPGCNGTRTTTISDGSRHPPSSSWPNISLTSSTPSSSIPGSSPHSATCPPRRTTTGSSARPRVSSAKPLVVPCGTGSRMCRTMG